MKKFTKTKIARNVRIVLGGGISIFCNPLFLSAVCFVW